MKRRGFLQAIFGAPAAAVAGVAVAKAESQFPKNKLIESEPPATAKAWLSKIDYDNSVSCLIYPEGFFDSKDYIPYYRKK